MNDTPQEITQGNPQEISTGDIAELAELLQHHVGAWQEFGYGTPPMPGCKAIPPLGNRDAEAITAGHEAIADIDRLTRRLHELRSRLVGELLTDSDIRGKRIDAMLAALRTEGAL